MSVKILQNICALKASHRSVWMNFQHLNSNKIIKRSEKHLALFIHLSTYYDIYGNILEGTENYD